MLQFLRNIFLGYALFSLMAHAFAFANPISYLGAADRFGFSPVSKSRAVELALSRLNRDPISFCEDPVRLVWWGSFGEFTMDSKKAYEESGRPFREIVLGETGIMSARNKKTVQSAHAFNADVIAACFK